LRTRRAPRLVVAIGVAVAAIVALPIVFLVLQTTQAGGHEVTRLIFRHLTETLLWNTVRLAVVVSGACAVVGTAAAWCVERTDLPGRRLFAALLVIPVAIPDFVIAYAWSSAVPSVHGLWGAAWVMTLALYPLVFLPVAATLRRTDPALEETARSLGCGRIATFFRATLPQIRTAILGGCLIVTLALLAEFGAFEILRYPTFTTTIFTEFTLGFNSPAASALSCVLVALGILVLAFEILARGAARAHGNATRTDRSPTRSHLVRSRIPTLLGLTAFVGLTIGVPIGVIVHWFQHGTSAAIQGTPLLTATLHTSFYGVAAAALACAMALPVAILAERHGTRAVMILERSTFLVQSIPGLVIGLGMVFFAIRYARSLYQTNALIIGAYAILFFPLALVCVRASVAQADPALDDAARSLGSSPLSAWRRVTLPLIAPGLVAGFCLVFVSVASELTLTLVLAPTGIHTLSTQFWAYESNTSYGAAAPYAAALIVLAVIPSAILSRWFERRSTLFGAAVTAGTPIEIADMQAFEGRPR
jgi:iron(III) transport system permease protein